MIYLMIQSSRSVYDVQGSIIRFYLDVKNGRGVILNDFRVIFENILVVKQCVFEYWYIHVSLPVHVIGTESDDLSVLNREHCSHQSC